jgi:hypothetical protein
MAAWTDLAGLLALLAAGLAFAGWQRRRQARACAASFAQLLVDTPQGPVRGAALRVVKRERARPGQRGALAGTETLPGHALWYCVGPGPSYLLATPLFGRGWRDEVTIDWQVQRLDAQRMRHALQADPAALERAFAGAATPLPS